MSYVVLNGDVFAAAYAGAVAGMIGSGRVLRSASAATYADLAAAAGGWAEAVDTAWGAGASNAYQIAALEELSAATWYDRTPEGIGFQSPGIYGAQVQALLASVQAGSNFLTSQSITPPAAPATLADVAAAEATAIAVAAAALAAQNSVAEALTNKTITAASNTITDTGAALGDILRFNGTRFVRLARGADTQVLTATPTDIEWAAGGGGGGTPGGAATELQYNNAGAFGGLSVLRWDAGASRVVASSSGLELSNPGATFGYVFVAAAIAADRTITLPLLTSGDTLVCEGFAATLTAKTLSASSNTLTDMGAALGDLLWFNGTRFVRLARGADTQVLTATPTDIAWAAAGGGTPGGAATELQYNNAGAFGGLSVLRWDAGASRVVASSSGFELSNPGATFGYVFVAAAIAADRTITLPLLTSGDTLVCEGFAATLTAKTLSASSNTLTDMGAALGDLLWFNGTRFVRLARGTTGQALTATATDIAWATVAAPRYEITLVGSEVSTVNTSYTRAGARVIDMTPYPAAIGALTRTVTLVCEVQKTGGTSVEVRLFDVTNAVEIIGSDLTHAANDDLTEKTSAALNVGAGSGMIRSDVAAAYELQFKMNGAGTLVYVTSARLLIAYA